MRVNIVLGMALSCAFLNGFTDEAVASDAESEHFSFTPSSDVINSLYSAYLSEHSCRPSVSCTRPFATRVSEIDCSPAGNRNVRCTFLFSSEDYMRGKGVTSIATEVSLEECTGMFRWTGKRWRMTAALDDCPSRLNGFRTR
jgi:hypothetical protein